MIDQCDVLVVGGGFAGVCAALSARRAGADVVLTERSALLGGQAAEIHTWGLDGFTAPSGKQIIKGIPWEILKKTVAQGGSDPIWTRISMQTLEEQGIAAALQEIGYTELVPYSLSVTYKNPLNDCFVNPNAYRYVCHKLLSDEGVRIYLEAPACNTVLEGNAVVGVDILTMYGQKRILAKRVIDTSQNGALCAYAGKPFDAPKVYMNSHFQCAGVDIERLLQYIEQTDEKWHVRPMVDKCADTDEMREMAKKGCTLFIHGFQTAMKRAIADDPEYALIADMIPYMFYEGDGYATPFVRVCPQAEVNTMDHAEYSKWVNEGRIRQWLAYRFFRDYVPGCENMTLKDTCPHIAKAHRISFEASNLTSYVMTEAEIKSGKLNEGEGIIILRGHPGVGQNENGWRLPLKALVAKDFDNLLLTGKPACKMIHYNVSCAIVGQAAGAAAAVSVAAGTPLANTSEEKIREELSKGRQGTAWF